MLTKRIYVYRADGVTGQNNQITVNVGNSLTRVDEILAYNAKASASISNSQLKITSSGINGEFMGYSCPDGYTYYEASCAGFGDKCIEVCVDDEICKEQCEEEYNQCAEGNGYCVGSETSGTETDFAKYSCHFDRTQSDQFRCYVSQSDLQALRDDQVPTRSEYCKNIGDASDLEWVIVGQWEFVSSSSSPAGTTIDESTLPQPNNSYCFGDDHNNILHLEGEVSYSGTPISQVTTEWAYYYLVAVELK